MAKCTNVTYLMHEKADTPGTFEKLIDITEYPNLGGEKEKLDVTTLSDTKKRTINGIEDTGDLAFKAWYEKADYKKLGVGWCYGGISDKRIFQQRKRNVILHH